MILPGKIILFFVLICVIPVQAQDPLSVKNNGIVSLSDSGNTGQGWQEAIRHIGDKRIVLLGEFTHGSGDIFRVQNDLIRLLHVEKHFNVVLFESGIGEMGAIALTRNDLTPGQMTLGFFGGWRTEERAELMKYLQAEGIRIGGFDVQRTGSVFTDYLSARLDELDYFESLEQRFVELKTQLSNYQTVYDSVETEATALILDYRQLMESLQPDEFYEQRGLLGRITYLQYMLEWVRTKDWNERWKQRDLAMADNIRWWLERLPASSKIIIVAHNYHIARYNPKEEVMGEFLSAEMGDDIFSLGIFGATGTYLDNGGNEVDLSPADTLHTDIKTVILALPSERSFINIPVEGGPPWLYTDIIVRDTFNDLSGTEEINLSRWFDGLIVLKHIAPPETLKSQ